MNKHTGTRVCGYGYCRPIPVPDLPDGYSFCPIYKPMGNFSSQTLTLIGFLSAGFAGSGYPLPSGIRGVIELDAEISTLGFHLIGCEIGAVVSDNVVWNTIMVHNAGYKIYHRPGFGRFNRFGFYPLGEFIHHDQQVFFFSYGFLL